METNQRAAMIAYLEGALQCAEKLQEQLLNAPVQWVLWFGLCQSPPCSRFALPRKVVGFRNDHCAGSNDHADGPFVPLIHIPEIVIDWPSRRVK
jgi:hypothetical protein